MCTVIVRYALREIKRRKLRSLTNIIGYVIAVAFLIITVAVAQGYNAVAVGSLNGIGTHFAVYLPSAKACPNCEYMEVGPFFKDAYTPTFDSSFVEAVGGISGVEDASPYLSFRLDDLIVGGIELNDLATEKVVVAPDEVVRGRYLKSDDLNGVMLDEVYSDLGNLDVGDNISAFGRVFGIVGIVNPGLHSKPAGNAQVYGLIKDVQSLAQFYSDIYGFQVSECNVVLVEVSPEGTAEDLDSVKQSVLVALESQAGEKGALVGYQCYVSARKVASIAEDSAWAISIVVIISVVLFSLKSQFSAIAERTKEIGVLKAIGWTDFDIAKQVSLESLLQGIAGGLVGLGLGYLITFLIPNMGLVPTQNLVLVVSPLLALVGFVLSLSGGILAGIVPAWRAAKLQPAEALRSF